MSVREFARRAPLLVVTAACMILAGCTDPVRAVLTGSPDTPTAILSPCRTDWHDWDSLEVLDSTDGRTLWKVQSATPQRSVPMARVEYGKPPAGAKTVVEAQPIPERDMIQWVWSRKDSEPVMQTFTVRLVKASKALETDDSYATLDDWKNC